MILQCEACGTRFSAPDAAFAAGGRTVRCGTCKHEWFFDPATQAAKDEKPIGPETTPAEDEAAVAAISAAQENEAAKEAAEQKADAPPRVPAPKRYTAPRKRINLGPPRWLSAMTVALFLVVCGLGVLNFAPGMVGFKPTLDFTFQGLLLRPGPGGKGYTVSGAVVNKGDKAQAAPQLRISLLDDKGRVVKVWHRDLPGAPLNAGERLSFSADGLDAPPGDIVDPHVRVELGNTLELALRKNQ